MSSLSLSVQNLGFGYANCPLIDGFSMEITSPRLIHIRGPNGSGKSTFLRLCAGLLQPHTGSINWFDERGNRVGFGQSIAWLGESLALKLPLSVGEHIRLWAALELGDYQDVERTKAALRFAPSAAQPIRTLSAGERKKLALIRLVHSGRPVWLLDEPFTHLDNEGKVAVKGVLDSHIESGGMIILTTHEAHNFMGKTTRLNFSGHIFKTPPNPPPNALERSIYAIYKSRDPVGYFVDYSFRDRSAFF